MVDKFAFSTAVNAVGVDRERQLIGTLQERTLHAVLKHYYEPNTDFHEKKIGGFYADIANEKGIIEIQTRNLSSLKKKLEVFLRDYDVTVVYPVAAQKWISWVDCESGEAGKKSKSPKQGQAYDLLGELYGLKPFLTNPRLTIKVVRLDIHEFRRLDGWDRSKKRGSSRFERIPVDIIDEAVFKTADDYVKLIPEGVNEPFTVKELQTAFKRSQRFTSTAVNVLLAVGGVERVEKRGRAYQYIRG